MYRNTILLSWIVFMLSSISAFSQTTDTLPKRKSIGIVISSNDPETVWNAFRLANYAVQQGDSVSVFLLGKGVESESISSEAFNTKEMMASYSENGGTIMSCGTCLRARNEEGTKLCPISTLSDLYDMIKTRDIILTF